MTNVNKGHSRMDTMKDGFNRGLEYLESGSKALALATALAVTGVHANGPTFVIDGQVYTAQQVQKNTHLLDIMDDKDYTEYMDWQMGIINDIEADTARLNTDTARLNTDTARLNTDTARRQENIDRQNEIQASNRIASSTAQNFSIMQNILMGNKNTYTFRQIAKAFDEVASDSSLNISDRSRQVYKTISQAYAQGNTLVYVSDEIKQAFVNYAQEVERNIQIIPAEYRESILSGVEGVMQLSKL